MINGKRQYEWKDVAILVRANAHAEPFVRALSRHGIPYQFLGPGQLFKQPEVKDLICYLKILYDIHDTVSMFRVLSMDHFAIPSRDIASLVSYARAQGLSLFEVCELIVNDSRNLPQAQHDSGNQKQSELGQNFVSSFHNGVMHITPDGEKKIASLMEIILKHLSLIKKETAGQILYYFLEETGLLKSYISIQTQREERSAENIAKFFDKLKSYEADHDDANVFAVVDWLDLSIEIGESPLATNADWNTVNAVNILTVHSAKGLEFPIVFLVNVVGARFPTTEKHEQIPIPDALVKEILPEGDYHLEEERRLFYVGMTRARDLLYFTASQYYGEGKREKKISPFVIETIGKAAVQEIQIQEKEPDKQLFLLDWAKQKKEEEIPVRHPVAYVSYSQVETFTRCPLQYKYRYVVRIPVPPSSALSFGDTIHRTLCSFYQKILKKEQADKDILMKLYDEHWKSVGYKNKEYEEKMKKHGVELLEEFFHKGYNASIQTTALEQPFKIKITPTLTLGGKIDRVDRTKDGKLEIIDYKTGSAPKKKDPSEDVQLSVYALAASEKGLWGEKPENILVSFYFLEGQEKVSGTRKREQLEKVREDIQQSAEDISVSTFSPTPGKHCDFCEFRLICEAWK